MILSVEAGSLGEWVSGLVAAALLVWTVIQHERGRRDSQRQQQWATASTVNAWAEVRDRWVLVAHNGGSEPVYVWNATMFWSLPVPGGGLDHQSRSLHDADRGSLPPGGSQLLGIDGPPPPGVRFEVSMAWQDVTGQYWLRHRGQLTREVGMRFPHSAR